MQTNTMKNMFIDMGLNPSKMEFNEPVPVKGWEIQTIEDDGSLVWKRVLHAVRKPNAEHMKITTEKGNVLSCTPEHRIFVRNNKTNVEAFREVWKLRKTYGEFQVRTANDWEKFQIEHLPEEIEVLDVEVEGTHHYLSSGILSHNTLYGDPTTTPGGQAIPYHSSVRLKLTGGQQIKKTINGKEMVVGISVTAKTIKNKIAPPWREVDFEIHFGVGVRESEQLFDSLREYCDKVKEPVIVNGKKVKISGTSQWKEFELVDMATGEIELEKFYKSEFENRIIKNTLYKPYLDGLIDACFRIRPETKDHNTLVGVDAESAEEMRAIELENEGSSIINMQD